MGNRINSNNYSVVISEYQTERGTELRLVATCDSFDIHRTIGDIEEGHFWWKQFATANGISQHNYEFVTTSVYAKQDKEEYDEISDTFLGLFD